MAITRGKLTKEPNDKRGYLYTIYNDAGLKIGERKSPRDFIGALWVSYEYEILRTTNPNKTVGDKVRKKKPEIMFYSRPDLLKEGITYFFYRVANGERPTFMNGAYKITNAECYLYEL